MNRFWTTPIGLLVASVGTAAVADDLAPCRDLPLFGRPCVVRPQLSVNDANDFRHVVVAAESEGIDQVRRLAGESDLEESWAFLPAAGVWVETGLNEVSTPLVAEVEVDVDYLVELVRRFQQVHLYHFHPRGVESDGQILLATPMAQVAVDDRSVVLVALPGHADILASFEITWALEAARADVEVDYFVVSELGTIEYGPTRAGLRTFAPAGGDPRASSHHEFALVAAVRMGRFNLNRSFDEHRSYSVAELIDDLCAQIADPDYRMTFLAAEPTILTASPR